MGLGFAPDGATLASVGTDGVDLWDSTTFERRLHLDPPESPSATTQSLTDLAVDTGQLAFSPDGELLAVSANFAVQVIELPSGRVRWSIATIWSGGSAVDFTDDGHLLAQVRWAGFDDYSLQTGEAVGRPLATTGAAPRLATREQVAVLGPNGGSTLTLLRLDGAGPLSTPVDVPESTLVGYVPSSGNTLLFGPSDSGTEMFTPHRSFDIVAGVLGPQLPPLALARPTGPNEIGGLLEGDLKIGAFDLGTGEPTRPPVEIPLADALAATFDPADGQLAISRSTGVIDLYGLDGEVIASPFATPGGLPQLLDYRFTNEGWLAGSDGTTGRTFVVRADGQLAFTTDEPLSWPTLSLDGSVLAGITGSGSLALLDGHTGRSLDIEIEVPQGTTFLQFSDDGRRMLTSNDTGGVVIDMVEHEVIGEEIPAITGFAYLRSDGMQVATNTGDGALLLDFDPAHWRDAACELAGRNLTRAEWDRYLPTAGDYRPTCDQWDPAP